MAPARTAGAWIYHSRSSTAAQDIHDAFPDRFHPTVITRVEDLHPVHFFGVRAPVRFEGMTMPPAIALSAILATGVLGMSEALAQGARSGIDNIDTVVMIYAENRSFDNLYGRFPGANGLQNVTAANSTQRDRDGSVLKELPPAWGGLTAKGVVPPVTQAQTEHLPNQPFAIDDPNGFNTPLSVITRDLWHRFYQNQMQINAGKNDRFVAYANAGGLVMGYYDGSRLPLWSIARKYVLADNFFQAAFGGSFVNHFLLACACVPVYPHADQSPARNLIAAVEADGVTLKLAANSPKSALDGIPKFVRDGDITPDFHAVNTMQPPYQPSLNGPAEGGDPRYADPRAPTTLVPQNQVTVGDLLPNFAFHHQPYNYFIGFAPGTPARAAHLKDGGMNGAEFIKAIDQGQLPQVTFYKPQGNLNEHPGYASALAGDEHIADVVAHLEKSPQWPHMLVLITYDENGGFWDHVAPPRGDRWGPGSRIPALVVSPFAKKGYVDHTQYDTTSILRFITRRFDLPMLPGLTERDRALRANGHPAMGDLTDALAF
jgi:phospholipase C